MAAPRARRVVEEIRHQLVRHVAEHVDDRRLVAPQPDRRRQREPADLLRAERGHLGGDPAAHRLADDVRPLEAERLHHVEAVQEEIDWSSRSSSPVDLPKPGSSGA